MGGETLALSRQTSWHAGNVVDVPVIAAGGIADARGVIAAFALGAEAVQIGTAFLTCHQSGASRIHREVLMQGNGRHTGLTKGFTGRLARGIKNRLMDELIERVLRFFRIHFNVH